MHPDAQTVTPFVNKLLERFQLRDLRAKATSDLQSMAQALKLLGHATENMRRQDKGECP